MKNLPSINFDPRPKGQDVDILIFHYTGMRSAQAALDRLCDPVAKVSAHYVIDEDGDCYRLVDEGDRAWHAGVASWAGATDINARSIGIEVVNPGHEWGYRPFPAIQMAALRDLARTILGRHPIPPQRVLAHSDVAPDRRQDPGELFGWSQLAEAGIGIMPRNALAPLERGALGPGDRDAEVEGLQVKLASFGYGLGTSGIYDRATEFVMRAFQRHFRPGRIDGIADTECQLALDDLLLQA
jgi:N-acetylmuramoyl-L-alanine amidase